MKGLAWCGFASALLFVACIDVGHDAEIGCLKDITEPGCRASGGTSSAGASAKGGSGSGGASRGGTTGAGGNVSAAGDSSAPQAGAGG